MTIGRRIVVAWVSGACVLSGAAVASADLPPSVREAPDATPYAADIDKFADGSIKKIAAGDAKSRDELCRQVETNNGATVTPSASFQSVYVTAALAHLQPLIGPKNDVVVRLNAAIIISRMCGSTHLLQLAPAVQILLNDPTPAVTLWGIKGAGALLPATFSNPLNFQKQKLTPAIVAAVAKHHAIPAIVQDAFTALDLPDTKPPYPNNALALCAETMAQILDIRLKDYQDGTVVSPQVDKPPLYLTRGPVMTAMTSPQRLKVVQSITNVMIAAARRAAATPDPNDRKDLYEVVTSAAGSMKVVMDGAGNTEGVARYVELLKVPGLMSGDQVVQKCVGANGVVRATPEYKDLKDPPAAN